MQMMKRLICTAALFTGIAQGSSMVVAQGQPGGQVDVLILYKQAPDNLDLAFVRGGDGIIRHNFRIVPAIAARVPAHVVGDLQNNPRVATVELDGVFTANDVASALNTTGGVKKNGAGRAAATDNT